MKIGFDVSQTGNSKAGCGFFAENLIHHLSHIDAQNQYYLYPTFGDHYWDNHFDATYRTQLSNFHQGLKHTSICEAQRFWQTASDHIEKKLGHPDVLHANNFFCPPKLPHTKIVYTLYDLSFLEYPDCTTEHNRIACFDGVFKASLNADLIIAISHYSRQHFLRIFPHFPADRIIVTHPASRFSSEIDIVNKSEKLHSLQPQKFWLNVGTIEPRKNIRRLLSAYAKLRAKHPQTHPLVLAGKNGWLEENIEQVIDDLDLKPYVYLLGYIDNDELQWLYQNCFCLVYPSLFEGFGLPVLEAMGFGAPVITSNVSSIPEVVGNAGLLINPLQEDELTQAMMELASNNTHREALKSLAIKQAGLFSWVNTAKIVLNSYQEVIALPKRTNATTVPSEPLMSTT
ncbi:MAG: glycosyltransferase family 4 protein [Gammaproteobacteria bacterium]